MIDGDRKPEKKNKRKDEEVLSTLRSRMNVAIGAYAPSREAELSDLKFAAGSPDNNFQWPETVLATRTTTNGDTGSARPTLTINKLPQHIKQVTNDQRQNRPSGKVIPANGDADIDVAEVFDGIVRYIEYTSDADIVYDTACENQVTFGEGYFRIVTEYTDENSFDQDILLKRIRNSFSVYMDPTIQGPCGEDAQWCIITEDLTKDEYEQQYPDAAPISSLISSGVGDADVSAWLGEDTVRIVEYFHFETKMRTLNLYPDGTTAFEGSPEDKILRAFHGEPTRSRKSEKKQVKWIKSNGYEILEESDWAGKYIPVIRVVGNEFEIDGELTVSGIVRNAKDAQRMYNYWTSQEAEMLALAPKAPFIGYGGQFEGYDHKWKTANTNNWPYLEVNPDVTDGNGNTLPLPQRSMPPMAQQGLIAAKQGAAEDIKATTGQYNASLGMVSNERSGKAILARQHEGDVGTYHYGDNLARAIRYAVRQIVDLIPKIYDTQRIAQIIGEDGSSSMVKIDPEQDVPVKKITDNQGVVIEKIYNPSIGKYDVRVVTGPGYATKRREALDAMAQLLQGNPQLWAVAGDLFVKNMDWPGAQELAKRFAKTIDPKLMQGDDESPALQQAKQQLEALMKELDQAHKMLQNVHNSVEVKEMSIREFEAKIKAYDAETKRISVTRAGMSPEQVQDIVRGTIDAAVHSGDLIGQIPAAPSMQEQPPQPQPQQMPGGPDATANSQPSFQG